VHLVHNWGWEPVLIPAPLPLVDVLDASHIDIGAQVHLDAWDVRVFVTSEG
jgi:hypothetical protein